MECTNDALPYRWLHASTSLLERLNGKIKGLFFEGGPSDLHLILQ